MFVGDVASDNIVRSYPSSLEIEQCVLGAIIIERDAILDVISILSVDSFYFYSNQEVYRAILNLFEERLPIDLRTVIDQLKKNGVLEKIGGEDYVVSLIERIVSGGNIEYHAFLILEYAIKREIINMSRELLKQAFDPTVGVFSLINSAEQKILDVSSRNVKRSYSDLNTLLAETISIIELRRNNKNGVIGVPSGFSGLDMLTSGWQKSDLIIIAARPAMGKTAFVLSLVRNAAVDYNVPVALFSLEMSSTQLVSRLIAAESGLGASKIIKGTLENYEMVQLKDKTSKISKAPIYIDDTPALSVYELITKCKKLKMKHDIKLVAIDYLQLLTATNVNGKGTFNRENEISFISRSLKCLAKELDIPIITLSQLSRAVEQRQGDKRPMLSDLRESGAIEQDADIVMFLYRPEYYKLFSDNDSFNVKGLTEVIIAKHRNGPLDTAYVQFINENVKFVDITSDLDAAPHVISDLDDAPPVISS